MALTAPWILLDTNVILYLLEGRLTEPLASGQYFVSVITEIELLSYPSLGSYEEMQIRKFLRKITVVRIENYIKNGQLHFARFIDSSSLMPSDILEAALEFREQIRAREI